MEGSSHWYRADATPQHNADLRTARKHGLFPSVTSIIKMWPKPMLDVYKIEQAIMSACTCPRLPGETDGSWVKRVMTDAEEHSRKAADIGTDLHDCLRIRAMENDWPIDPKYEKWEPWKEPFEDFFKSNVEQVKIAETAFTNVMGGFAGTVDLAGLDHEQQFTIWDFKTREWEEGDSPRPYPEYLMQLVAYGQFFGPPPTRYVTVMAHRTRPEIETHHWAPELYEDALIDFMACRNLWFRNKKYDPRPDEKKSDRVGVGRSTVSQGRGAEEASKDSQSGQRDS